MSATLGGTIKDYRMHKHITKKDMILALGWSTVKNLDTIEDGTAENPDRVTIDKICRTLRLTDTEKNTLLLAGNYLPTKKEIQAIRKKYADYIEEWQYPAVVYDFCWRIILFNKKTMKYRNREG